MTATGASRSGPRDLVLRRPDVKDIPALRPLPVGYGVRSAEPSDAEALAVTLTGAFDEKWDLGRVRRDLIDAPDVVVTYVGTWQDTPVATASSRSVPERFPDSGYVHWVGTSPQHTRRGLAAALLITLLQHFDEIGRSDAVLETQDHRRAALRSYLRLGFVPVLDVDGEDHRPRWSSIFPQLFGPA